MISEEKASQKEPNPVGCGVKGVFGWVSHKFITAYLYNIFTTEKKAGCLNAQKKKPSFCGKKTSIIYSFEAK